MSNGSDLKTEADKIAAEFHRSLTLGQQGRYTKGFEKIVPQEFYKAFVDELALSLGTKGIKLLDIGYDVQGSLTALFSSFVISLGRFWGPSEKSHFRRLLVDEDLIAGLTLQEMMRLLDECVLYTSKRLNSPVTILLVLSRIPFTLDAMRFVNELESLVIGTNFYWCIISPSRLLHLFNGRSSDLGEMKIEGGRPYEEIYSDTEEFPMPPHSIFNRDGALITHSSMPTIGNTNSCEVNQIFSWFDYNQRNMEFGMVRGNQKPSCSFFFAFPPSIQVSLSFSGNVIIPSLSSGDKDVEIRWPGKVMRISEDFDIKSQSLRIYDLEAFWGRNGKQPASYCVIPSGSFVRFRIFTEELVGECFVQIRG